MLRVLPPYPYNHPPVVKPTHSYSVPLYPSLQSLSRPRELPKPQTVDTAKLAGYITISAHLVDKDARKLYGPSLEESQRKSPQTVPCITSQLPPFGMGGLLTRLHNLDDDELSKCKAAWKDIPTDSDGNFLLYFPSDSDAFSLLYRSIHYIVSTLLNGLNITELEFFHGLALVEQVHLFSKPESRLQISLSNVAMMISIGVLLAHKFHSDRTYTNATFSKCLLLSLSSVCSSERYFLQALEYRIMNLTPDSILPEMISLFSCQ